MLRYKAILIYIAPATTNNSVNLTSCLSEHFRLLLTHIFKT